MSEKTVSPAITATKYMVQWEEHPSHLASRLGQLLEQQTLVDVTLMCNTHTLRVHRAVLAACSPYFETILQRQLGVHPLIVLKDMQFNVLKSLIEFMYCGETSVTEENLGPLLQAAKFFQVKGLSSMTKEALGLPATPAKTTTAPTSTTTPTQPRTVSKTTPRTTTTTTVRNATPLVRTPETGTATTTTVSGQQQRKTLLTTGQQQASATAAALARGKRVVTQQTPVRPGQGSTTVYGQPRRAVQQTPTSSAISSTSDSGQPWRATSASPKETQQHDTAQLLLSLGNEYPQQKASPGQAVANKTSLMNKGRVVTKAETPNGGLKTQTATTTGSSLNKIVMKPQQTASSSLAARKRVQQTPRSGQSNMLMNKQAETKTITSSISNQVNQSRSQPATYAHQKRKTPPQQTTVTQTQQNQQQQLVAVASEEDKSGTEQTSVVYQLEGGDLAGNVVYQLDESLLAASDANIVYQLPDGTTVSPSELQGNMLYQVAADEPQAQPSQTDQAQVQSDSSTSTTGQPSQQYLDLLKAAGIPTDMPVLLDNGNGEYVAVNEEMLKSMVNGGMLQISDSNGEPMQLVVQEEQSTETNTETPTTSADDNKPEAGQSMPSLDLENNQQQHEQTVTTTSASALSAQSMPTLEESNTNNEGLSVEQALEAMMGVGSEPENKTEEIIETTTTTTTNTLETTESVLNKEETETVETKETRVEGNNEMDVIDQLIQESAPTQEETTIQAEPQDDSQENIKEILEQTSATDTSNANTIKNENSTTNKRKLSTENNTECESEAKRVKETEDNFQEEEKLEEKTEEKITDSSEVEKEKPTEVIESDIKE